MKIFAWPQAQSEINDGAQAIRQAQGYGGMGINTDTSSAQSQLMQAEQLLRSQNYEQSIQSPARPLSSPVRSIMPRCSKP